MLSHRVIDSRSQHPFDFVRIKGARCPCAPDEQQIRVSSKIDVATIEPVEGGNHDDEPLPHAALEEFSPNIVPFVKPVIDLPHLLLPSIRIPYSSLTISACQTLG